MGKKDFKPRHMRSVHTDSDGVEVVQHITQVGPSSFVADSNPPDSGYCDHCGVELDERHFASLLEKLADSGVTIHNLQKRLSQYDGDGDALENAEELAHLDDESDAVGTPDPYDDVVGSEF